MTDLRPYTVLGFVVLRAQPGESHQFGVNGGLFDNERIPGSDCFDFGISERAAVDVLAAAKRGVAAHDLVDELGFGFERLPHIRVEASFGDVAVDLHDWVGISLAKDAAFALFHVCGSPTRTKV